MFLKIWARARVPGPKMAAARVPLLGYAQLSVGGLINQGGFINPRYSLPRGGLLISGGGFINPRLRLLDKSILGQLWVDVGSNLAVASAFLPRCRALQVLYSQISRILACYFCARLAIGWLKKTLLALRAVPCRRHPEFLSEDYLTCLKRLKLSSQNVRYLKVMQKHCFQYLPTQKGKY